MKYKKYKKYIDNTFCTGWKIAFEVKMLLLKPFAYLYLVLVKGVSLETGYKFYGLPRIFKYKGTTIRIGERFENRNWWDSNPLGINHPTIICTWEKSAKIKIGDDVGISGGSIVATENIEIGDGTLIGTNTLIVDSDFHPARAKNRRYKKEGVKSIPVKIGKNVFLGTNCTILKGATIPDDTVIPAGSTVRAGKNKGFRVY